MKEVGKKIIFRLHRILFFILVVLLPIQLGRHWWPSSSYIFGLRIDYLSPTLYLTDLLILGILGFWGIERILKIRNKRIIIGVDKKNLLFFLFFIFLVVNCFLAKNQNAAFYKLAKIIELSLLGSYVAKTKINLSLIAYHLSLATIYSSLIAIAQFFKQASLNGLFYWLGERTFSIMTPGIAKAIVGGRLVMRPYATFPHPNALAGFILVSLILINPLKGSISKLKSKNLSEGVKYLRLLAIVLGIITIIISFSRSVWLVGLLVSFFFFLNKKKLFRKGVLVILLGILGMLGYWGRNLSTGEAISQRFELAKSALMMIRSYPLAGTGFNNFIVRLPDFWQKSQTFRFLQPVHNIYLLIAAETGLVGLVIFLWFLILTFRKLLRKPITKYPGFQVGDSRRSSRNFLLFTALAVILLLGLVDHYWLTLQQTQLLLTIVLGLNWGI